MLIIEKYYSLIIYFMCIFEIFISGCLLSDSHYFIQYFYVSSEQMITKIHYYYLLLHFNYYLIYLDSEYNL
jgi:hypothetical protein